MSRLATLIILLILFFSGCTVAKQWIPTGGSRADGTVKLSYELKMFQKAQVDDQQGLEAAKSSCKAWGYDGAQAFGGQTKVCNNFTSTGSCNSWLVTSEYQCIGNLRAS